MPALPPPVTVISCAVTPSMTSRQASGVAISFVNAGTAVLHHVTFEVGYHTIEADIARTVQDTGSFGPGVRIDHHFDEFEGVSFLGTATESCVVTGAD
jgi:hypothetical protein